MCDHYDSIMECREVPKKKWQYFYRNDKCESLDDDQDCICWRDEGTGPIPSIRHDKYKNYSWREKTVSPEEQKKECGDDPSWEEGLEIVKLSDYPTTSNNDGCVRDIKNVFFAKRDEVAGRGELNTDFRIDTCNIISESERSHDQLVMKALSKDSHQGDEMENSEPKGLTRVQELIMLECRKIENMLIEKNRKYGNSVIEPKRVFSKAGTIEQINVRLDDKISRIMSAQDDDIEDAESDLIGYLIIKRVAKQVVK